MSSDYKSSKEAFVSGMTGSTITHINMVSAVALSSIALYSALRSRLGPSKFTSLIPSWSFLMLPLLFSMTIFANSPGLLSLLLLVPTALLLFFPSRKTGTPLPSNSSSPTRSSHTTSWGPQSSQITPLPALTTYRAHMLLMTILAILAVDFPVFPRSLAKCETFGVSVMDLGVGSFVFSQGIVSAIPLLKDPLHLTAPIRPKFFSVIRKSLPIIFIGLVRVVLVKGTEYPEHESEYGTHWNFFITLALLPAIQVLLHPLILRFPISLIGVLVALSQQISLSFVGLENFVQNAPRVNIVSANKEGIASLTGYMAIHLLGLSTGTLILPPSPSFFRRRQLAYAQNTGKLNAAQSDHHLNSSPRSIKQRETVKTAAELFSYAVIWWFLTYITRALGVNTSRKMANISYILWVAAFNASFILGYLILDMFFFPLSTSIGPLSTSAPSIPTTPGLTSSSTSEQTENPPPLLEAINKNGLVLFLFANLATGLINLTIPTMYTSDLWAILILVGYSFGICTFAWIFRDRRIWRV